MGLGTYPVTYTSILTTVLTLASMYAQFSPSITRTSVLGGSPAVTASKYTSTVLVASAGLSPATIGGISGGVVAFVLILAGAGFFLFRYVSRISRSWDGRLGHNRNQESDDGGAGGGAGGGGGAADGEGNKEKEALGTIGGRGESQGQDRGRWASSPPRRGRASWTTGADTVPSGRSSWAATKHMGCPSWVMIRVEAAAATGSRVDVACVETRVYKNKIKRLVYLLFIFCPVDSKYGKDAAESVMS